MKAVVTVSEPCTCGQRWFACTCGAEIIAEYECEGLDGTGFTCRADIETISALHPGKELIYA